MSFAVISGAPMHFPKVAPDGERERLSLLASAGMVFDPEAVRVELGRGALSRNDVVDAAVMLMTAMRIERGDAVRLPAIKERDERWLLMKMWA